MGEFLMTISKGRLLMAAGAFLGLCVLQWLGDAIVAWAGWPVPGSLVGLLMLLGLLMLCGGVPDAVEDVTQPLLRHLMLLLIPSVASVSVYGGLIAAGAAPFMAAAVIGTALTSLATGLTLQLLWRRSRA